MQSEKALVRIFTLARKIANLLNAHPSPYEAEAACTMAQALASARVKQWPFNREDQS